MANNVFTSFKKLNRNIKELNSNNYKPIENKFYIDGLSVNKNGNVYITDDGISNEEINKLINERRI